MAAWTPNERRTVRRLVSAAVLERTAPPPEHACAGCGRDRRDERPEDRPVLNCEQCSNRHTNWRNGRTRPRHLERLAV